MELGMGVIGWAPNEFWNSTMSEFSSALAGVKEFHGSGEETEPNHMTKDRLKELMELYPD